MTPYQNMPPAGSPPGYQPPVVPRPLQNPAYAQEKKCLRQSANCFGVAAILYFVINISALSLIHI